MSYKSDSLSQLIDQCNRSLVLPHIQRPFVWDKKQMIRLLDSLMRGYPIQTLLFWKTREFIKARKFMDLVKKDVDLHTLYEENLSREGVSKVFVLDGQQRLQTLFTIFNGAIEEDGKRQEAWIDLLSGNECDDDGLHYKVKFESASPGPTWFRISDLRGKYLKTNDRDLSDKITDQLEASLGWSRPQARDNGKLIGRNVSQLASLLRHSDHFWYEELDGEGPDFPYDRVLDIFVRINSGGTKLDGSDLMFAAMKGLSGEIEENVEEVAEMLNQGDLQFDKGWVLKCLVMAHGEGAVVDPKLFQGDKGATLMKKIEADWPRALDAFQQLQDLMTHDLRLYSDKVVRSYVSFIPLFVYLFHSQKPDPAARTAMVGYFYKAQLFNWYGASTDKVLNSLNKYVCRPSQKTFPLDEVKKYFHEMGRETELTADNIGGARVRLIILNLLYLDLFGASAFSAQFTGNLPQADHIYPRSMLVSKLGLPSDEVNHLGNFRFVGATDNNRKRAQLPDAYFAGLKAKSVPIEKHLLVEPYASDPFKLMFDVKTYRKFRDARFAMIFERAKKIVDPELP